MDWQQKAAALDALAEIEVRIRKAGDWYVHQDVWVKDGCVMHGIYGNGETPEEAIIDHWKVLVEDVNFPRYLIARQGSDRRRAVVWNGFMWADIHEPKRTEVAAA